MATLEQVDLALPLELSAFQRDLDKPVMRAVEALEPIVLEGDDLANFMAWAKESYWRAKFEEDLQSVANDSQGRELLTTWLPLVTFREQFCCGGRHLQNDATRLLMERLRAAMRNWRDHGVDTVDVSGRALHVSA